VFGLSIRNVSCSSKFTDFTQPTETRAEKLKIEELRLMAFHELPLLKLKKNELCYTCSIY